MKCCGLKCRMDTVEPLPDMSSPESSSAIVICEVEEFIAV